MHQDGHPRLRSAPAAGPRPYASQFPPSSGFSPLAGLIEHLIPDTSHRSRLSTDSQTDEVVDSMELTPYSF